MKIVYMTMGKEILLMKRITWICLFFMMTLLTLCSFPVLAEEGQSHLFFAEADGSTEIYVEPGETVELRVRSVSADGTHSYQWFYSDEYGWEAIEGADAASYTTKEITARSQYICRVTDVYGNGIDICFNIYVQNELAAYADGENIVYASPGESAELRVDASCTTGALSYQWYIEKYYEDNSYSYYDHVDGADEASYIIEEVSSSANYYCRVTDEYNNNIDVYFSVCIENKLTAKADGDRDKHAAPGETAELKVNASCSTGTLGYQWYISRYMGWGYTGWEKIEGAGLDTYVTDEITAQTNYCCRVTDEYGNYTDVYFNVFIENEFSAEADGGDEKHLEQGESLELKVNASCASGILSYKWSVTKYTSGWGFVYTEEIQGADQDTYVTEDMPVRAQYTCTVSDEYGNSKEIYFNVFVDNEFTANADGSTNKYPEGECNVPDRRIELSVVCRPI